jgi:hypothetical protein
MLNDEIKMNKLKKKDKKTQLSFTFKNGDFGYELETNS